MTRRFVIGIDPGTTYSAVAFYIERGGEDVINASDVRYIANYPREPRSLGRSSKSSTEVPSEIWYGPDGKIEFGYEVVERRSDPFRNIEDGVQIRHFKLLLDHTREDNRKVKLRENLIAAGKSLPEVITDYIQCLLAHTKSRLRTRYSYVDGDETTFIVTIPALWNITATEVMKLAVKDAAARAGFHTDQEVFVFTEPDAATAFVLDSPDLTLEVGETFTVCDAGGGTVDLITYTMLSDSPHRWNETVKGTGDLCGSSYLDEAFQDFIEKILKDHKLQEYRSRRPFQKTVESCTTKFEGRIKRRFDPDWTVPEYVTCEGFGEGRIELACDWLYSTIFLPQMKKILGLIKEQHNAATRSGHKVKKVLLVGGFADSKCLFNYLEMALAALGCELHAPESANTAVASGAILRYFRGDLGPSEIVRSNYAFGQQEKYDPSLHDYDDSEYDHIDNMRYVKDCLNFFLNTGERLPPEGKIYRGEYPGEEWHETIDTLDSDLVLRLSIFQQTDDGAVQRHVPFRRVKSCCKIGEVDYTLVSAQLKNMKLEKKYKKHNGRRKAYYKVKYKPMITIKSRNLSYEILMDGESKVKGDLTLHSVLDSALPRSEQRSDDSHSTRLAGAVAALSVG